MPPKAILFDLGNTLIGYYQREDTQVVYSQAIRNVRDYLYTLRLINEEPQDCIFIGDDPRWDVAGPQAAGMPAVLLDRGGIFAQSPVDAPIVHNLYEFYDTIWQDRKAPA